MNLTLQPHPVHARPDAVGHHRHRDACRKTSRPGSASFKFLHGPIFANIVLADEINRTPPKTQAALLEAMQERQVTVGRAHGTSCPIRSSCWRRRTPSSRKAPIRCPKRSRTASCSRSSSITRARRRSSASSRRRPRRPRRRVDRVFSATTCWRCRTSSARCRWRRYVIRYAMKFARFTRPHAQHGEAAGPERAGLRQEVRDLGRRPACRAEPDPRGQGPRAAARPLLRLQRGRPQPSPFPVLRHRIITNFNAEAEGIKPDEIVRNLLALVPREGG